MIPCTFLNPKLTVTGADPSFFYFYFFFSSCATRFLAPLIKPVPKQPATCIKPRSRQELLGADNNTKWIFPNREKQLSLLFECFTFPRSINWLFDHRQRCALTDKEQVISKVAWRSGRQPAAAACWR